MSFTVKEIINEAFDRTGIFPNPSDALPGEMFSTGLKALKGLVNFYNIKNYIVSTQRMAEVTVPPSGVLTFGKDEAIGIDDVAGVNTVYWNNGEGRNTRLKYTSFMNFPAHVQGSYIYSWNQSGEKSFDIYFQKWMAGKKVIVMYNVPFDCAADTVYYLPPEYSELFILGLCVKLLGIYPREDKTMLESMGGELTALTGAIEAKQADSKLMEWNRHDYGSRQAAFQSGEFLGV